MAVEFLYRFGGLNGSEIGRLMGVALFDSEPGPKEVQGLP